MRLTRRVSARSPALVSAARAWTLLRRSWPPDSLGCCATTDIEASAHVHAAARTIRRFITISFISLVENVLCVKRRHVNRLNGQVLYDNRRRLRNDVRLQGH